MSGLETEAELSIQEKTIYVDSRIFSSSLEFRSRFSIAHEIGHYILHKDFYTNHMIFESIDEYINFYRTIDDRQYRFLERHANEFAGAFLVPKDRFWEELKKRLETPFESDADIQNQLIFVCEELKDVFNVSAQVLMRRIVNE